MQTTVEMRIEKVQFLTSAVNGPASNFFSQLNECKASSATTPRALNANETMTADRRQEARRLIAATSAVNDPMTRMSVLISSISLCTLSTAAAISPNRVTTSRGDVSASRARTNCCCDRWRNASATSAPAAFLGPMDFDSSSVNETTFQPASTV